MSCAVRVAAPQRLCDGAIAVLELGPPPANVLDRARIAALREGLAALAGEPALKAILIRGAGAHFSYGASVPEHLPGEVETMLPEFHALLRELGAPSLPPVIAVVRGRCLGGGLELALACDLIAVAEDAQLACPEVKLGVFPPAGAALLSARAGAGRALDLVCSGRAIRGAEAAAWGLAAICAPAGALDAKVEEWAREHLLTLSGSALRHARRAARAPLRRALEETLPALERQYLEELMATRDAREGLDAFLAKRAPKWSDQ